MVLANGVYRPILPHSILSPLPHVAVHIEQTQVVWLELPYRPSSLRVMWVDGVAFFLRRICAVPSILLEQCLRVAVETSRRRTCASRILPLRFGGQSVSQPVEVVLRQLHSIPNLVEVRWANPLRFRQPFLLTEPV